MTVRAAILGCAGPVLTKDEAAFLREAQPWGFILFARNIEAPDQVRRLTADLRAAVDRPDAPVLVDQEGGRVARFTPPHWRRYPPARAIGDLFATDAALGREIAWLGGRLIAHDLAALGVTISCLPVLDVPVADGHPVIGDRAYATDPDTVARLGRAAAEGLMAGGVLPVMKHMPGHGRATADTHQTLPVVDASFDELRASDFAPFRALADLPIAMTAHVVYGDVDATRPATLSETVVQRVIRGAIGFEGLVMSDDLAMKALSGSLAERAQRALAAGCDIVLHGNGRLREMRSVMDGAGALQGRAADRAEAALARLRTPEPFDAVAGRARFDAAFEGAYA